MFTGVDVVRSAITIAIVVAGFISTPSEAQWAWKDANGRTVYSDRPPPPDIKAGSIVRQPNTQTLANPAPASGPLDDAGKPADGKTPDAKSAPNAPKTVAEREMEFRKRQQERAESEKKATEEQTKSAAKTAECDRARGYMKSLEDGIRITKTDASGNREFLDDSQRAAEMDRTRKIIQSTCG
jgi:type IV secretory pathway VirB10-like protein